MRRDELLKHKTVRTDLKGLKLGERSYPQRDTVHDSTYVMFWKRQNHRDGQ